MKKTRIHRMPDSTERPVAMPSWRKVLTLSFLAALSLWLASPEAAAGGWPDGIGTLAVSGPATPADLAETPEIVIDDEIRALALRLGNHPVEILEHVRNNFVYEPYRGARKSSVRVLAEGGGNDIDLASLAMALLRASGIHCRYVCGTIEMPAEEAGRWIGIDDPAQTARAFQAAGIPFETVPAGGGAAAIRLSHVWVAAFVDYLPYRGARNGPPNTWLDVDPSFKQNIFSVRSGLRTAVGINPDTLLADIRARSESGGDNRYAAGVPEAFILSGILSYREPLRAFLAADGLTAENAFRKSRIEEERHGVFTVTDNYGIVSRGSSFDALPQALACRVGFELKNADGSVSLSCSAPLPAVSDSRFTLSYRPASASDHDTVVLNAGAVQFPAFAVELAPELRMDGAVVAAGGPARMGREQFLETTFHIPGLDPATFRVPVAAGSFSVLTANCRGVADDGIVRSQAGLAALAAAPVSDRDLMLGEALRGLGLSYWHQLDRFNRIAAGSLGVVAIRAPGLLVATWDFRLSKLAGMPHLAVADRIRIEVVGGRDIPVAIDGARIAGERQFAFVGALTGVALEHNALAQPFGGAAVSAARVIQQANASGQKIHAVTAANIDEVAPLLDVPAAMLAGIRDAANANIEVIVPEAPVPFGGRDRFAMLGRDIATGATVFRLDSGGGETGSDILTASDLLIDGPAESYRAVVAPLADWLEVAVDATAGATLAYLPAVVALNSWHAGSDTLDPVVAVASVIALSGPVTQVYSQPAILNVAVGDTLISPDGDGVRDSFSLSASVTRNAAWRFRILNAQGAAVVTEEGATPLVDICFDQNIPDGVYVWRITAEADGVSAEPVDGTFRVDCTPPSVILTAPDPAATISDGRSIALRGTVSDVNLDKAVVTVAVAGGEPETVREHDTAVLDGLLATIPTAGYPNGPVTVVVTAADKAGNVAVVSRVYTLDNPAPDLEPPTVLMSARNGGAEIVAGSTVDALTGQIDIAVTAADNVGVGRIDLLLDGNVVASAANAVELVHAVDTATLRDGVRSLQAEAFDAAGNSARTALLGFTLTSPVSNFRVTPSVARPGVSAVVVSANLRESGEWRLVFEGPGAVPPVAGEGVSVYAALDPAACADGEYVVTLEAGGRTPQLPFVVNMILNAPVARISNLEVSDEDAIPLVREGLFTLTGTADDADVADVVRYKIEVFDQYGEPVSDVTPEPVDAQGYREGRVADGVLGELDFTMLRDNVYTLRLTVTDGQFVSTDEARFALDSRLKIGQMSFSQQDLIVPAGGMPVSVIRAYDSLNTAAVSDFGPGWTYGIKDIEAEFSEERASVADDYGTVFSMRVGGGREVTLTLPDGRRAVFRHRIQASGWPYPTYKNYWDAPPGVHATLDPVCSNEIVALPGGLVYWTAAGPATAIENFDIPGFILTLKDGTRFEIVRENLGWHEMNDHGGWTAGGNYVQAYGKASLRQITARDGSRLVFGTGGIESYDASGEKTRAIVFERDAAGRIVAVYGPGSLDEDGSAPADAPPDLKYEYDDVGNLARVARLTDRAAPGGGQYAVTEYLYGNPERPHFVTAIKDPSGNIPMRCEYDENGRLIATVDAFGNRVELRHDLAGRAETVFDRAGNPTVHVYDARGNVLSTTDAQGRTSYMTYSSDDSLLSTTDPLGNTVSYAYDARGNRTSVTDPLGNTTFFTYDAYGNQLTVTDALGNTTTNVYDASGNLLSTTNALGQTVANVYDANGNLSATYDAAGRLTASFAYDSLGNLASTTDAAGVTRSFSYDADGNQTGSSFVWSDPDYVLPDRTVATGTVYDAAGQAIAATDPEGNTSSTVYNENGKPVQTTDKLGNVTTTVYDARGNVVETQYPDGTVARTVYDANGRASITQDRHVPGRPANGSRTIYDSVGRVVRSERLGNVAVSIVHDAGQVSPRAVFLGADAVLSSTSSVYDAAGRVISATDAQGNTSCMIYSANGSLLSTTDALGNRTGYAYDAAGRQTAVKDALNRVTAYQYDALGRRVRTVFPDGTYAGVEYNLLGQKTRETDQSNLSTTFEYDTLGRLAAVVKPSVPDPETGGGLVAPRWEYAYNIYGQQVSIKDPKGRLTRFSYDHLGRQLSRTLPMGQTESMEYNSLGQLSRKTDFKGQATEFFYDGFGRLAAKNYYPAPGDPDHPVNPVYSFSYDDLGRMSSLRSTSANGDEAVTSYSYDLEGRTTQIQSPEGTINYEYDIVTGRKTRTWTANSDQRYTYDELGRLKTVSVHKRDGVAIAPETTFYSYTAVGSRESVELPNGVLTEYTYNNLNRLTSLAHYNATDELLASYSYTLAPNGRRTGVSEQRLEPDSGYSATNISYQYDGLNRLVAESSTSTLAGLNFSTTYDYDLTGNRLRKSTLGILPETISYSYNANDQLTQEASSVNGNTVYGYDVNGSLTTRSNATTGESSTYTYNLQNRLSGAAINRLESGQQVDITSSYTYNVSGIRVRSSQTVNGIEQNRIFLADSQNHTGYAQVLEETSTLGGTPVKSYTIGDDILAQNITLNTQPLTHHFLYDGHGSTRLLTSASSVISARYDFDAYGMMLGGNPNLTVPAATDMLYSGEQFDVGLQQQYLRARYYNQNNGQFNRLDDYSGNLSDPQSLHKYAYCHNDPVNGIDPSGEIMRAVGYVVNSVGWVGGGIKNNLCVPLDLIVDALSSRKNHGHDPYPEPNEKFPGSIMLYGNFAGKGWRDTPYTRPVDMWDLAAKIHDLNYCVNKIGVFENTFNLLADSTMRSRKAKADYIFRIMTQAMSDNVGNVFWGFGANFYFAGSGRFDFRKNDGFVNALREDSLQRRYLMTPFSKLDNRPQNVNYNQWDALDDTWNEWKMKNIIFWNQVSNITDQTGL